MLEITHLSKNFGRFLAVDDLNLHIKKGELFGFVGHNGAGKTTTMKITAGLLTASAGRIMVDGIDAFARRNEIKRRIGYMPDFFGVYDNLKAIEYMEFYASMYGIVGKAARKTCLELMELVNLSDKTEAYVDSLSRGMKQRLCLARSLVHNPQLLLLDEPASGLDPRARFEMKEILKNLGSMGKTVVISSHILPELADMCDTIGIMQRGKLLMYGTVEDIQMRAMHTRPMHLHVLEGQEIAERILKEDPQTKRVSVMEKELVADYGGDDADSARLLTRLVSEGVLMESFYREKGNLESLFLEITADQPQNGSGGFGGVFAGAPGGMTGQPGYGGYDPRSQAGSGQGMGTSGGMTGQSGYGGYDPRSQAGSGQGMGISGGMTGQSGYGGYDPRSQAGSGQGMGTSAGMTGQSGSGDRGPGSRPEGFGSSYQGFGGSDDRYLHTDRNEKGERS